MRTQFQKLSVGNGVDNILINVESYGYCDKDCTVPNVWEKEEYNLETG